VGNDGFLFEEKEDVAAFTWKLIWKRGIRSSPETNMPPLRRLKQLHNDKYVSQL
jgi:hypothetical protein